MKQLLETLCAGKDLARDEVNALFSRIVRGELSEIEVSAVLVALKAKGESADEIAGAADAMRAAALPFDSDELHTADTCGTGGDGAKTVNISTAVALVAAELGISIVKHGNRSVSSRCGSADVLEQCGVKIDAAPEVSKRCLETERICFLFAPQYHSGVRHVMGVRRTLGVRTIFNVVGPLSNPARPRWQVVGVYDPKLCLPIAKTLRLLGCEAALVVHGAGLDEIGLHAPTHAALLQQGDVRELTIDPTKLGLKTRALDDLRGGDVEHNAAWLRALLAGEGTASHNEAVALNAGAVYWICGRAADLKQGYDAAYEAICRGGAAARLQRFAELSHAGA